MTRRQTQVPGGLARRRQHTAEFVRDDIRSDFRDGVLSAACSYTRLEITLISFNFTWRCGLQLA